MDEKSFKKVVYGYDGELLLIDTSGKERFYPTTEIFDNVLDIFLEMSKKDNVVSLDDLFRACKKEGIDKEKVEKAICALKLEKTISHAKKGLSRKI